MIVYDFVEVGTCCFDTLIEKANDNTIGLSIEPLKTYQDMLPDKPNVHKVNVAFVADEDFGEGSIDFYHIPMKVIKEERLGEWLKGCNTVGKPHDFHTNYYHSPPEWHSTADKTKLKTYNLLDLGLVTVDNVKCMTFTNLVDEYKIGYIKYLKIDTEGYDCKIVNAVLDYFGDKENCPDEIFYESNSHSNPKEIALLSRRLQLLGYKLIITQFDTLAKKKP
jgi:hypothetical protein